MWGLGCVLIEILSRLRGYKLDTLKSFWRLHGSHWASFAQNQQATAAWVSKLTKTPTRTQYGSDRRELWLISFLYHTLLVTTRLLRPTADQVLERLQDLDFLYPAEKMQRWVAQCCRTKSFSRHRNTFNGSLPHWPNLDLVSLDDHLAYLFLDENLRVFAHSKNLSFLERSAGSGRYELERLLPSQRDQRVVSNTVHTMMATRSPPSLDDTDLSSCLAQSLASISIGCLKDVSFAVEHLNVNVESTDKVPRIRTVQLSCHTICLSRQLGHGRRFFVMTFDPEEGEMTREDVDNPKYNPEIHVDKLAFGYEPPKLCHLKREHRGVWTDGLSVAVKYPNESTTERYSAFQTLMSNRRHTFNELVRSLP
jgi:hypothetical protein